MQSKQKACRIEKMLKLTSHVNIYYNDVLCDQTVTGRQETCQLRKVGLDNVLPDQRIKD